MLFVVSLCGSPSPFYLQLNYRFDIEACSYTLCHTITALEDIDMKRHRIIQLETSYDMS